MLSEVVSISGVLFVLVRVVENIRVFACRKKKMQKETMRFLRELATYGSVGMSVAFSIFIGVFAGVFADRFWNTAPWGLFIGLALGLAAAFKQILWMVRKMGKGEAM